MCLLTTQKKAKIAKMDLVTYKMIDLIGDEIIPTFQGGKPYEIGKLNKTEIKESPNGTSFDYEDLEFYKNKKGVKYIVQGFHSSVKIDILKETLEKYKWDKSHLYLCIIPKGSQYYTGYKGLTVSDKIIIIRKLEL